MINFEIKYWISKFLMAFMYLGSILLGNFFVIYFGILEFNICQNGNILFQLVSPAGVIWIGLTFSFRDLAQRFWGKHQIWIWMIIAAIITYYFNQAVALASVASFVVSETIDWLIFTILKLDLKKRIVYSNLVAAPIDSFLFVTIAFGFMWEPIIGQAILKVLCSLLIIPAVPWFNRLYIILSQENTKKYIGKYSCKI